MKKIASVLVLGGFVLAGLSGCGGQGKTEETKADTVAVEVATNGQKQAETIPDFKQFWAEFSQKATDKAYLTENTDFPVWFGGMENKSLEKDDFLKAVFFEDMLKSGSLTTYPYGGKYLNGFLKESFTKKYGSLDNLYVAETPAEPIGYLAYFKLVDGKYKFIGYEIVENAG